MTLALVIMVAAIGCSKQTKEAAKEEAKEVAKEVASSAPAAPGKSRPRLVRGEPLPALARKMIRDQMRDHGDDMESLLWTVLMLDYESAASIADVLGQGTKLARPPVDDRSTLNAQLPAAFFDFQDDLFSSASLLSKAALDADDAAIAKHFGDLNAACVGCHALYLKLPKAAER